jgi:hypothetical protein
MYAHECCTGRVACQVFIETMDKRAFEDGTMSERNSRQYLA